MPTVTSADGTEIAYDVHGAGPPLVLLHGGSTSEFWNPVVPRLSGEYTVYAPDRRAHGDSGDGESYSLRREVEDVLALLEVVDGTPVLYGHSFGGLQAIEAARETDVEALVAYEPAILVGEYREQAALADRMAELIEAGDRRGAMREYVRVVLHGGDIGDEELDRWLEAWPPWPEFAQHAERTLRMNRAVESYGLPERLDVEAPALMLTGDEGPSHLRDSVRATHEALPDSRLVEFEGVGHVGPTEAADRVTSTVRAFLDGDALPTEPLRA